MKKKYINKVKDEIKKEFYSEFINKKEVRAYSEGAASNKKNAFRGQIYPLETADRDIGDNKDTLMARSIDQYMNNSLGNASIRKFRTNIVGKGLVPKPSIDNNMLNLPQKRVEEFHQQIKFLWDIWTEECDIARVSNFGQLQSLAIMNSLIYGETFALMPMKQRMGEHFELKIQLIESTRCIDPPEADGVRIKNGVEMSMETGELIAYYFAKNSNSTETVRVPAYGEKTGRKNILMVMEKERINQRRGVPLLAPVLEEISMLGKYAKSEVMAAVVTSFFTVFLETDPKSPNDLPGEYMFSDTKAVKDQDGDTNIFFGSGSVNKLPEGMKAKFADPNRPNVNFGKFMESMAKLIGASLEIPHEVLLSSFNSSYSASRAALAEAWKSYIMRRKWFVSDFCKPIYEEFLDEIVLKGYIKLDGYLTNPLMRKAYQKCEWYGPTQASIDPSKDATAATKRVNLGISTIDKETQIFDGGDFDSNYQQMEIENKKMGRLKKSGKDN